MARAYHSGGSSLFFSVLLAGGIFIPTPGFADDSSAASSRQQQAIVTHERNENPPPDDVQRNDLVRERLNAWSKYEIISDTSIRVFFSTGTQRCYGNRAVLVETPEEIRVAIVEGNVPELPVACTADAKLTSFLLHTRHPISGRKIIPLHAVELNR